MVQAVFDPIRVPSINLSQAELDEIEEAIEAGDLPKDFLDRYFKAVEDNVFGADHKKTRKGDPIEQGLGSAGNQTKNSVDSYKKYCNPENPKATDPDPNFKENLARMVAELAEADARRAAERDTRKGRPRARRVA